jgi:hypothetical protein
MRVGRFAVKVAVMCLLAAPAAVLAQSAPTQSVDTRASYATNRNLKRVVICGSIGAIAGALGSLRKRGASDTTIGDEDGAGKP